ncbi:hypothetical protein Ndes2526B_g05984 [Nannochloris sp. 'desiccata']
MQEDQSISPTVHRQSSSLEEGFSSAKEDFAIWGVAIVELEVVGNLQNKSSINSGLSGGNSGTGKGGMRSSSDGSGSISSGLVGEGRVRISSLLASANRALARAREDQGEIPRCKPPFYSDKDEIAVDPDLLKFCIDNGTHFGNTRVVFVQNGWRGVIATQNIHANTCVLRVPRKILLSCESARLDADIVAATSTCPPLSSISLLAVHLLHELSKGPASFWADYLRSLPPSYTTAISLSTTEASALQVPYAQHQVAIAARAADLRFTDQASPVLDNLNFPSKWRSRSAFLWALSALYSRTMFLGSDSEAGCLTPFGDLFNYEPPEAPYTPHLELSLTQEPLEERDCDATTASLTTPSGSGGDGCLNTETNEYCIYVRKDYSPGEEIFLCYGRYTNLELLEHYGFVLLGADQNPHDTAVLPWRVLPEAVIMQIEAIGGSAAEPIIHANGNPSWEFLRALRMAALTPAGRKLKSSAVLNDEKADDESEIWVMKTLIKACQESLGRLPTTLNEDEELLRKGGFKTEGLQVVVQWRCGYKRILSKTIEICTKVLKALAEDGESMKVTNGHAVSLINLNIRQPKLLAKSSRAAAVPTPK